MAVTIFILFEVATRPATFQITQENKDPELSTFPMACNGNTQNSILTLNLEAAFKVFYVKKTFLFQQT